MIRYLATCAAMAVRSTFVPCVLAAVLSLAVPLSTVRAAITPDGDVSPTDPTTWTSSTTGYVGNTSDGTLTVNDGSTLASNSAYLGYTSGATGVATVDGSGSTWTTGNLDVGYSGTGALYITGGGTVDDSLGVVTVGYTSGSVGVVTVNGGNSTLRSYTTFVGEFGSGTLNITGGGTVNSGMFAGWVEIGENAPGAVSVDGNGSTLNLGGLNDGGTLYCGYFGNGSGTLNITNGGTVNGVKYVSVGATSSPGVVNVDGNGSTLSLGSSNLLHSSSTFECGVSGNGTLNITGGGTVDAGARCLMYVGGSAAGVINVDGKGSTLNGSGYSSFFVGDSGSGTLNISGGAAVTGAWAQIASNSVLGIDVGTGSSLTLALNNGAIISGGTTVTNGTITNDGTVRLLAGAGATKGGPYSPITAPTWNGAGAYQAIGGTWDNLNHLFTVSDVKLGTAGLAVPIDLENEQRVLISDNVASNATGWTVGASFLASATSKPLSVTATPIGGAALSGLESLLGPRQSLLGGWEFAFASGYAAGDPAYLSFDVGAGYSRNGLEVWHYDGANWTEFAANDLTYDGTYASFTVTGFSGYAVTTVPEPGTLALLVAASLGLCVYGRRKKR